MDPDIITTIAATLTTVSLLPQMIKTIRTKETHAISLWMYILYVTGVGFWTLAGVALNSTPMVIGNGIGFFMACIILALKIKQDVLGRKP